MSGAGESQGGSVIPNGQPPQWNYPGKLKPQHNSSITSNGTPTPPSNSYAGSLSSQSSRDPSPIPTSGQLVRSSPSLSQDNIPLVRQSPDQSSSQYIVNGPQVTSVQRTGAQMSQQGSVPPSSHSSSTSASSYSNPDLSASEHESQANSGMSHSITSAYSRLDSATRHPPAGGPGYRPLDSGSNYTGPPSNKSSSNIKGPPNLETSESPQMESLSLGTSEPPISAGTSNTSGPSQTESPSLATSGAAVSVGTSDLSGRSHLGPSPGIEASEPSQMGPPTNLGASGVSEPSANIGPPKNVGANLSGPLQMGLPASIAASNISGSSQTGPPTSVGASNLSESSHMGPPTSVEANLSGPPQMGPPTNTGASYFSGLHQMGTPKSVGASNTSGPPQLGPSGTGASNLSGSPQMRPPMSASSFSGPPASMGTSAFSGTSQLGPPVSKGETNLAGPSASVGGPNIYGSQQIGPTSMGTSNLLGPPQMRPSTNVGGSNLSGPPQMGPLASIGGTNLSRFPLGPPSSVSSNLSTQSQIGHPMGSGAPNFSKPPLLGPTTNMAASNLTGASQMVSSSMGDSNLSGPPAMGLPTSSAASNLSGPPHIGHPTNMGASNFLGPSHMGPPANMAASNFSGPSQMGPPTSMATSNLMRPPRSMGASNFSGPPQMGPPTGMGVSNLSGPPQMTPSKSIGAPNLAGPQLMRHPTSMGVSNLSGPPQMGPPTSMGASNLSAPPQMGPPTSIESSNPSGPLQMAPPTGMGSSNLAGPQLMRPPTSMGSSNLAGPHQMGPPTSMGASNLSGPHQMGPPTSIGSSDLSGPHQMGPPTSMGASNLAGPHQMGPPTSIGSSNLSGPHQMGPPTSMGASNLAGPHQMGPPTSMGASNLSGPHQMGPPTSMGASNLAGPHQMGPPTSMGASNLAGSHQMGPPTSVGSSNLSGPLQMAPPTSLGTSNISGPQLMRPPTSVGASNLAGPHQMGPPTSIGASNISGPPQMGPQASVGPSNLSGPLQMNPPTSMGASNLAGPHQMGPPTSMGTSNIAGPHQMGPPTSMGTSNIAGPPQMGPPTSVGPSQLSGPHQMGPPTNTGALNLSGPYQMGPPTSMGASNLSGPRQMGPQMVNRTGPPQMAPPTSMGGSSFGPRAGMGPPQMRPPTSMESSNFAGPATGPPRSMAPSYPAETVDPQRNMAGPPPAPSSGYMASRQGGMPPPRPSQYPGAPSQPGPIAQDHRQNYQQFGAGDTLTSQFSNMSVTRTGFNKIWGMDSVDLLQYRNVLPAEKVEAPKVRLHQEFLDSVNCSPDIFRCTLTKIPESNSLLQKSRLPLGILIHPFKDLNHLPVIQCSTIVRCRSCRTYINPFVYFVDHKRWKCNLCFRVNELPEEFQYDPVSKTYGDPTRRPEVKSSTIEFIAPSEYMLRPPQPAVYLFLLDVSQLGVECGYLNLFCDTLLEELDKLPGDGRTQIGFITYDSSVHFYNLSEGLNQPQQMIVVDTDEIFLPCPDNLLVNLAESRELVIDLLKKIPTMFLNSHDTKSSLGPALQAAYKLMAPTGGRVTVFQSCLPNHGPGALVAREDPSQRAGKDAPHLNPVTDFYKRLALDCSGQQIAVDLFVINSQYVDIATISGISRFSGGCIHHFPLFKTSNAVLADSLERCFRRYLTRKIGFEAVMRIRCSRGLGIHTFHGNFFVRSTDLLSLPNVNPDAGFGMQVSVEENLSDIQNICFQAALLYTSSKGERRIRVHTLCLPVAATLSDILYSADQQCIVGLLAKMAVDRSLQSSLSDARDAFINVAIDVLSVYKLVENSGNSAGLLAPMNLRLLPMYILALLKYVAFRTGQSTRLDDRLFAMCQMKSLPLSSLIQAIYPDLYPVHCLNDQNCEQLDVDGTLVPQPPRLHLSAEKLDSRGAFLMDAGDHMMMYIGSGISNEFCSSVLGVPAFSHIPEEMYEVPEIESPESERLRNFVNYLQSEKPYPTMLQVIRDDSNIRGKFIERLIEDRSEAALSYYEFLQHLKANIK